MLNCRLSQSASVFDDWNIYDEERPELEPAFAHFDGNAVLDLLDLHEDADIIIEVEILALIVTFKMTLYHVGAPNDMILAQFPCPDKCTEKFSNAQVLLTSRFCRSHVLRVLAAPNCTHLTVRHKNNFRSHGIYASQRIASTEYFFHFKSSVYSNSIFVSADS